MNTNAHTGPSGSHDRSVSPPPLPCTTTGPRSIGDGNSSTMKSSSRSIPIALAADPHDHRGEARPGEAVLRAADDVLLGERALFEVLLDQVVVGLGHRLDQLLARRVGHLMDLVGPLRLLGLRTARVQVGFLVQEVGDPAELVLGPDRQLERRHLVPERRDELREGPLEVRALSVELVDEDRAGEAGLDGELPGSFGLHLDAVDGRDHHDHGVGREDRRPEIAHEVGVARRVEHVDLDALPLDRGHRERDGDALALLVGVVVGDGVAVLHDAHAGDRSGREQHGLEEGRLPRATVTDQQDVADVLRVVGLQRSAPSARGRGNPTESC